MKSSSSVGPRSPAFSECWLSATGTPWLVVSARPVESTRTRSSGPASGFWPMVGAPLPVLSEPLASLTVLEPTIGSSGLTDAPGGRRHRGGRIVFARLVGVERKRRGEIGGSRHFLGEGVGARRFLGSARAPDGGTAAADIARGRCSCGMRRAIRARAVPAPPRRWARASSGCDRVAASTRAMGSARPQLAARSARSRGDARARGAAAVLADVQNRSVARTETLRPSCAPHVLVGTRSRRMRVAACRTRSRRGIASDSWAARRGPNETLTCGQPHALDAASPSVERSRRRLDVATQAASQSFRLHSSPALCSARGVGGRKRP